MAFLEIKDEKHLNALVAEGVVSRGASHTARFALKQGKPVFLGIPEEDD